MPRTDNFISALKLAQERLSHGDPLEISQNAGANLLTCEDKKALIIPFFCRPITISYPAGEVACGAGKDILSLQEQGLILHYLLGARDLPPANELITFREIPAGEFYYQPFLKRAKVPLVSAFGSLPELFRQAGKKLAGTDGGIGDISLTFRPFPRIPITLVLWQGDDELPPEGNILFDASIKHFLVAEDIAFLAGITVYKLIALSQS